MKNLAEEQAKMRDRNIRKRFPKNEIMKWGDCHICGSTVKLTPMGFMYSHNDKRRKPCNGSSRKIILS